MVRWQQTDLFKEIEMQQIKTGVSYAEYCRMNDPNYGKTSTGEAIAMAAPSIFMSIVCKAADGSWGGGSSGAQDSKVKAATAQQIKSEIQTILTAHKTKKTGVDEAQEQTYAQLGITTVDDLEAYLESRYSETGTNIQTLEANIQNNNNVVSTKTARNQEIGTRIRDIETRLGSGEGSIAKDLENIKSLKEEATAKGDSTNSAYLEEQESKLEQEKIALETEKTKLEKEKTDNENEINEANIAIQKDTALLNEFKAIQKDIDDLKTLSKQLKKAEGKDAIEDLTNDKTADIVDLLSDYNKETDPTKKEKRKEKLVKALQEYVNSNPTTPNKTIMTLAKQFGVVQ